MLNLPPIYLLTGDNMTNSICLFDRRETAPVKCGDITIGGNGPISVQTMTKCDTRDVDTTVAQIRKAVACGAEIVRVAVVDDDAAKAIAEITKRVSCPIVADIHFDYKLALASLEAGAHKVRVNPGNIGGREPLLAVARKARSLGASIRLGVNSGSLEKDILARYGAPSPEAMVESARRHLAYLEDSGIQGIVLSLKSSRVKDTVRAYKLMAEYTRWPFHIGITEAGPGASGIARSAAGIGTLIALGIGDTVRVSLTGDPCLEVSAAKDILQSMEARTFGPEIISCPTCGRTQVDLIPIAEQVSKSLRGLDAPIKVAVMGCPVNGPGEAREADIGVACGRGGGILFSRGKVIRRVATDEIVDALLELAKRYVECPEGVN